VHYSAHGPVTLHVPASVLVKRQQLSFPHHAVDQETIPPESDLSSLE